LEIKLAGDMIVKALTGHCEIVVLVSGAVAGR
jgi:hypothetical protein